MQAHRDKLLWMLVLVLLGPCVAAVIWIQIVNSPARRVRSAGAAYTPNYKSGNWVRAEEGTHFDNRQLAIIIKAMKDFREPHHLTLSGQELTDQGFAVFSEASNISSLGLVGLSVSDAALTHLDQLDGLKHLAIMDCPNISDRGVKAFREANPSVKVVLGSMEDH